MKRLILMRHAKSDWTLGQDDHERPLNKRGQVSAAALGDWLRAKGYCPDQVLCSSAMRTRQTLQELQLTAETRFESSLYLADPAVMLDTLSTAQGGTVLVIAHNPGIAMLAQGMVRETLPHPRFQDFPTGATLVADFECESWDKVEPGKGQAQDFVIPRELTE
ncbi:MAG: SixA phosphatase family protein [Pelagimonas sp.]|uniref:SixA phosphatase family protein n=1 Tax=Pelagimonas sp. TaxID=2073170 RepID=UPI003D6BF697